MKRAIKIVLMWAVVMAVAFAGLMWVLDSNWVQDSYAQIERALTLLGILGTALVFLSLILTIDHFNTGQRESRRREQAERDARIDAVLGEVEVNQTVCFGLLEEKEKYLSGSPLPESRFEVAVVSQTLALGAIEDSELRRKLWNAYRQMSTANNLMQRAVDTLFLEHVGDPTNSLSRSGRRQAIKSLMDGTVNLAESVRPLLQDLQNGLEAARSESG